MWFWLELFFVLLTESSCFYVYGFLFSFDIYICYHPHPQSWLVSDTLHCLVKSCHPLVLIFNSSAIWNKGFHVFSILLSDHISCRWCIIFHITKTNICKARWELDKAEINYQFVLFRHRVWSGPPWDWSKFWSLSWWHIVPRSSSFMFNVEMFTSPVYLHHNNNTPVLAWPGTVKRHARENSFKDKRSMEWNVIKTFQLEFIINLQTIKRNWHEFL